MLVRPLQHKYIWPFIPYNDLPEANKERIFLFPTD